jgi:hypothetical protein
LTKAPLHAGPVSNVLTLIGGTNTSEAMFSFADQSRVALHTPRSATGLQRQAHGSSHRRTPAPLRHGYAGVRLDHKPVPLLHKTWLRKLGPVNREGGTLLRMTHSGLPDAEACASHEQGWTHYLGRLAVATAGGDPGRDPRRRA